LYTAQKVKIELTLQQHR